MVYEFVESSAKTARFLGIVCSPPSIITHIRYAGRTPSCLPSYLPAVNQNEALNRGGAMFVENHPDLKIRVAHGNTLTAAVLLHELPKDCKQVFMSGATSKLGRAVSIYLARKNVEVLVRDISCLLSSISLLLSLSPSFSPHSPSRPPTLSILVPFPCLCGYDTPECAHYKLLSLRWAGAMNYFRPHGLPSGPPLPPPLPLLRCPFLSCSSPCCPCVSSSLCPCH